MRRRYPPLPLVAACLALAFSACTGSDETPPGTEPAASNGAQVTIPAPVTVPPVGAAAEDGAINLSALGGRSLASPFTLVVDNEGAESAKLFLDGAYVTTEEGSPPRFEITAPPGEHEASVRVSVEDSEVRVDLQFTISGAADVATTSTSGPVLAPAPSGGPAAATPTTSPASAGSGGRSLSVDTADEIRSALASARPGDVITVVDGEYEFKPRLVASASGTPEAPIILQGTRAAVIRTKNASGDYGLHVTGDHWRIEGLTVAHATKGIVLDGSVGTVIDGVEVFDIGDEGVHFRTCSSDGVLRNSFVHDTGRNSAQYGEGVYVGSANSNWSKYQCADPIEGQLQGDNTERVLIEGNLFQDITAEGADLKEGTDSGTLRGNVFRRVGGSGMNSADSAVDVKGNNWVIEDNTVEDAGAPWLNDGVATPSEFTDGYQTHQVYDGYGNHNVFRRNRVVGPIPGYGVGLYPLLANTVGCDNTAPEAALGLVGANGKAGSCQP